VGQLVPIRSSGPDSPESTCTGRKSLVYKASIPSDLEAQIHEAAPPSIAKPNLLALRSRNVSSQSVHSLSAAAGRSGTVQKDRNALKVAELQWYPSAGKSHVRMHDDRNANRSSLASRSIFGNRADLQGDVADLQRPLVA
jgi:hypothetical protein